MLTNSKQLHLRLRRWIAQAIDVPVPAPPAAPAAATESVPAPAVEQPALPPLFGGFPYMLSVLSPGVVNLQVLPSELTDDELIAVVRAQVTANVTTGCLALGPDRAVYFQPDGAARVHPRVPRIWCVEIGVLEPPCAFEYTPDLESRLKAAVEYVAMLQAEKGHGWGDEDRGGVDATEEEARQLQGFNDDGSPRGLTRCATCGDHHGRCLDPLRKDIARVLSVYCRCQNINRCARCGHVLHERRLEGNYYRPEDRLLMFVPGVCARRHVCPGSGRVH